MKMKSFNKILAAAAAVVALSFATVLLPSCNKDVTEQGQEEMVKCTFKINVSNVTGNSVKLSAIPSKLSVKYYLSVVRKDIFELYDDKNEFAADNLEDVRMDAEEMGTEVKEYVSSLRITGSSPKTVDGLSPETDYVAFVYGVSDEGKICTEISAVEFSTVKGEKLVDMDFDFEMESVGGTEATVKIVPQRNDVMYYYDLLPVAEMTKYTEAQIVETLNSDGTLVDHCSYGVQNYTFTGLKNSTKYCVFAFVFNEDAGYGKFKVHEFTTADPSEDVQANYRKWIGTWTVTSKSSELLGKPVSFDIVVSENVFCESYKVSGWGISIARTLPVWAGFDMETGYLYFTNAFIASRYSDSSISGYICHFGRFDHGDGYYLITESGIAPIVARLTDDNNGEAVGTEFSAGDSTSPYVFSSMDYFLYAEGNIYNFSTATQFTYGDFPVGPYTIKKKEFIVSSDMTFDISVEEKSATSARVSVVPSKNDETYFYDILLGSDADSMDDQMLVMQLESIYTSYGGIANNLCTASTFQTYSGMTAGEEYCVVAFGYDVDHSTTKVFRQKFSLSGASESNALILGVTNITENGAIVSVSPSSSDSYFCNIYPKSFVDHYSNTDDLIKAIDTFIMSQGGIAGNLTTGGIVKTITTLEPNSDYVLVAFGYNYNAATSAVYKKSFKTDVAVEASDAWKAWLGTWELTSSTSEKSKQPITMDVVIAPGTTGKKYKILGLGISGPRNAIVATVEGEYQPSDGAISIMNNQVFAEGANYGSYGLADVVYCARVYDSSGKFSPIAGQFYALSGIFNKDSQENAVLRCATQSFNGNTYTVSTMEVTMLTESGAALYYDAAAGYNYGDYPVGPFTMKKKSDSYELTPTAMMSDWNWKMNRQYMYYQSNTPIMHSPAKASASSSQSSKVSCASPKSAGAYVSGSAVSGATKEPVKFPTSMQIERSVQFMKPVTAGNRPLGAAFMISGGKLSWKFDETISINQQ